jgi:hypothetical protein
LRQPSKAVTYSDDVGVVAFPLSLRIRMATPKNNPQQWSIHALMMMHEEPRDMAH